MSRHATVSEPEPPQPCMTRLQPLFPSAGRGHFVLRDDLASPSSVHRAVYDTQEREVKLGDRRQRIPGFYSPEWEQS